MSKLIKVSFNTDMVELAYGWSNLQKEVPQVSPDQQPAALFEAMDYIKKCEKNLTPTNFVRLIEEAAATNLFAAMIWAYYTSRHRGYSNSRGPIALSKDAAKHICDNKDIEVYRAWLAMDPSERPIPVPNKFQKEQYEGSALQEKYHKLLEKGDQS